MRCNTLLVLLAVGLSAGDSEYFKMYTSGVGGGEVCGRDRYCHSSATCKNNETCVCKDDLEGNGKLYCKRPGDKVLYVENDLHIRNFYDPGENVSLPSPCGFRLARLVMEPSPDISALVEMAGVNLLFKGGHYFLTQVIFSIKVEMDGDTMRQAIQLFGDVTEDGNYTLIWKNVESIGLSVNAEGVVQGVENEGFRNFTMDIGKDAVNNQVKVVIRGLGITLLFRPPSIKAGLDNMLLRMVPGAVLVVDEEHWPLVNTDHSAVELSSWPQGPSLAEVADTMSIDVPRLVQYLMLNNSYYGPAYYDQKCVNIADMFQYDCTTESARLKMLEMCSPIYTDKEFLEAVSARPDMNEYMTLLKRFYDQCEFAVCVGVPSECESLKKDIGRVLVGKPSSPVLDSLKCESIFWGPFQT